MVPSLRSQRLLPWIVLTALTVTGGMPAADGDEPSTNKQASPYMKAIKQKERKPDRIVFSNEDLETKYGPASRERATPREEGSAGETAKAEAEPGVDPLQQIADEKIREAEQRDQRAAAEQKVADARRRVQELEKRVRALKNPLLARPQTPDEGAEARRKMGAAERVAQAEAQLVEARAELASAERELASRR